MAFALNLALDWDQIFEEIKVRIQFAALLKKQLHKWRYLCYIYCKYYKEADMLSMTSLIRA